MTEGIHDFDAQRLRVAGQRLRELGQGRTGGPDRDPPDLRERLAKLEGAFDWLKVVLTLLTAVMIGGFAFLGVQVTRTEGRVSELGAAVSSLPDKINSNLLALTRTLADAIAASKQTPPQVIIMPAPAPPGSPSKPTPQPPKP